MRPCASALVTLLVATVAIPAKAQQAPPEATQRPAAAGATSPTADVTTAAELFRQGRAALDANDVPTARARLLESARLDPRIGTFISLAVCEETLRLFASARTHWQQAADLGRAQADVRAGFALDHLAAIDARVPRVTLQLPPGAPRGTSVRLDDVDLGAAGVDIPLPTEVGHHEIVVQSPGHEPARTEVDLVEGQSYEIPLHLGGESPAPPPAPLVAPAPAAALGSHGPMRVASYATMGLGVVVLGVGTYFGVKAIDGKNPQGCTGNVCTVAGATVRNDAITDGNVSTGLFIGGGAVAAAGAVLWWLSRPAPEKAAWHWAPAIGPGQVGLAAGLTFR